MNPTRTKVVGASPLPASAAKAATGGGEPVRRDKSVGPNGRTVATSGEVAGQVRASKQMGWASDRRG